MLDLGFLFLLTMVAAGLGLRVVRLLGRPVAAGAFDSWALAIPTGLGLLGLGMLALGQIGSLTHDRIVIALGVAAAIGLTESIPSLPGLLDEIRTARPSWAWDALLGVVLLSTLLAAMAPVTDGDALCYHLQVPKVFLIAGEMTFAPDLHETVYPLLTEMLYAIALTLRGPVACRLIQWSLGVAFAMNVMAMARPILGDRARWAGTIAMLVPAVSNGMAAPLNDVALAAFGNAAIFAFLRWADRPCRRASILVGLLVGMAVGVKYPALVLGGLIGLAMLGLAIRDRRAAIRGHVPALISESRVRAPVNAGVVTPAGAEGETWVVRHIKGREYIDPLAELNYLRQPRRSPEARHPHRFQQVWLYAAVAIGVGIAWYLRAYHYTGNPVYPFFRGVFGGAGLDEVLDPIKRPMAVTAWNLLTAIGPMTLDPARFDSFAHQFGPLFLLVLPAMLWERAPRRAWAIVGLGYAFLTLCLTQRQSMRFVLIAVGPMSVGVAWVASRWWDRRSVPARMLAVILVAWLGFEATIAASRVRHGLGVVLGRESPEAFLERREPTYRVGRWIDGNLPAGARLVGQDHRGFYIPRPYAMELAHRRRTGLGTRGESADEVAGALRDDGFTHLLLCPPDPADAVEFDPTLGRLLAPWTALHHPIYRERIVDPDGVARDYQLFDLHSTGLDSAAPPPGPPR